MPHPISFLHDLCLDDIPAEAVQAAETCLIDLLCVAAAGRETALSTMICNHAADQFGAGRHAATMLFDGRRVSPAGAALAGGMTIDSIDAHDGYRPAKGHAGCGVLPGLLALSEAAKCTDGPEFLAALVVGYELACRLGTALHQTVPDYHTSGAWVSVAVAGLGARVLALGGETTRHALGIAEYHGPRSQMMRCIDHPTMLKDGSGWGAMAGVSAAYLAKDRFTGAPAVTVDNVPDIWSDLGTEWLICEQYFKPSPVCRWAQAPIEAALALCQSHDVTADMIDHVQVSSFHEAIRLHTRHPLTTEEAQYSLPYPVAAAIVRGRVGPAEIAPAAFDDADIRRLSGTMVLSEADDCNAAFPQERYAYVTMVLKNGDVLKSERFAARGDPDTPLDPSELQAKYDHYAVPVLGRERSAAIRRGAEALKTGGALDGLTRHLGRVR